MSPHSIRIRRGEYRSATSGQLRPSRDRRIERFRENERVPSDSSGSCAGDRRECSIRLAWGWIVVFLAALVLYGATLNTGPQWQDSGRHIWRIVSGQLVHPLGLALSHPLHYWIGRAVIAPDLWEPAAAISMISAVAGALAVANVYGCTLSLTRSRFGAAVAAGGLAFAHTFWQMSTRTETYTLTAALLSGECWMLLRFARTRRPRDLAGAFFLNGLGLANHPLALLTTPVLAVVWFFSIRRSAFQPETETPRSTATDAPSGGVMDEPSVSPAFSRSALLWLAPIAWLVGSLPYTGLTLREIMRGGAPSAVLHSALFGKSFARAVLNTHVTWGGVVRWGEFLILNFPNLLLPLALFGLIRSRHRGIPALVRRAWTAALACHALFVLRYDIVDQYTFLLPTCALLAMFAGIGAARIGETGIFHTDGAPGMPLLRRRFLAAAVVLSLSWTPALYAFLPGFARSRDLLKKVVRGKPYRDDYVYLLTPWSCADRSAAVMARKALDSVGDAGLIVVEDSMALDAVRYAAYRSRRTGVEVIHKGDPRRILAELERGGRVVLVPHHADQPQTPAPRGRWRREGDLYVLEPGA
ncbi:MAG: DUF2723 domain-containing protein [Planctomycetota bacterium]|nr:MAG: DUF2723 domain-containing protein [Planctomycetota bacterium]